MGKNEEGRLGLTCTRTANDLHDRPSAPGRPAGGPSRLTTDLALAVQELAHRSASCSTGG
ncbi:hypothetical protein E2562_031355 [Oryza meyeriana var. granulata]|uniref:Uncharacterized protein n=1 Tax=Oryza meyeriana var. granulata TaxID=110450 RepID=A0A6G1D9N7_9ORYZ|nr:hypothetical protein E2562_031355 [Oryza meyeriana var. granulata]